MFVIYRQTIKDFEVVEVVDITSANLLANVAGTEVVYVTSGCCGLNRFRGIGQAV